MSKRWFSTFLGLCALGALTLSVLPACAQSSPAQPKPPMFTYVANWQIPRSHWAEVPKADAANKPVMDKALADGTIVGYGDDELVVHTVDGETHDDWWTAMSIAGLLKVRAALFAAGTPNSPAMDAATKHWDEIVISRYYNKKTESYKNAYTWVATYQLKPDAPSDAVESLSQNIIAPFLEKMFADGTLLEYEIDELAVHSDAPGTFTVVWVSGTPEGVDKVNMALVETLKAQPLIEPAFGSMTKSSAHRDELLLSEGAYK